MGLKLIESSIAKNEKVVAPRILATLVQTKHGGNP